MSRRKRKKRAKGRPRLPTVVSQSRKTAESTPLPYDVTYLQPDRTVLTSRRAFILAPVEACFDLLAKQLEQLPDWDPIVSDVQPISLNMRQLGATSRVTLNLGKKKLESMAVIYQYQLNRAISWALREPKVSEEWRLERKPHGTMAQVTLAHEIDGSTVRRLLYKVTGWKKVEQDLDKMLIQLKAVVEGITRNQMVGG